MKKSAPAAKSVWMCVRSKYSRCKTANPSLSMPRNVLDAKAALKCVKKARLLSKRPKSYPRNPPEPGWKSKCRGIELGSALPPQFSQIHNRTHLNTFIRRSMLDVRCSSVSFSIRLAVFLATGRACIWNRSIPN